MVTLEYQANEALLLASARAQFWLRLGWRWAGIAALIVLGTILFFFVNDDWFRWLGAFVLASGLVMTVMWVKAYREFVSVAAQTHRRLEDPTVHIELNDRAIEVRSSIGSITTRWDHVTRRVMTQHFMIMFVGKQLVTAIPLSALTSEAEALITQNTPPA